MPFEIKPEDIKPLIGKCIGVGVDNVTSICARITRMDGSPLIDPPTEEDIGQFRCAAYLDPNAKWRLGNCPLATHLSVVVQETGKRRVGQQKQKRKNR